MNVRLWTLYQDMTHSECTAADSIPCYGTLRMYGYKLYTKLRYTRNVWLLTLYPATVHSECIVMDSVPSYGTLQMYGYELYTKL